MKMPIGIVGDAGALVGHLDRDPPGMLWAATVTAPAPWRRHSTQDLEYLADRAGRRPHRVELTGQREMQRPPISRSCPARISSTSRRG